MRADVFIKLELVISLAIACFTLIGVSNLVSFCFYLSFIVMLFLFLNVSMYRSQCKTIGIIIILLSFISVLISAIFDGEMPTQSNLVFYLVFSALIMYIYILLVIDINYKLFNWIMNWGVLFSACFPTAYYIFNVRTYEAGYLIMNFSNSNLLGMWILQAIVFALINLFWQHGLLKKVICMLLCIANIHLLFLSGTRNALLALALGVIIILFRLYRKKKFSKLWLLIVAIFPIIFVFIYLNIFPYLMSNEYILQSFMEGKSIDTRYSMWMSTLYNLKGHIFTGSYFNLAGNLHNSHLVVWASYGIIVLILVIFFLYKVMYSVNNQCDTFFQNICLVAFFITVFMGIGEGSLFSGAVGLYIPACIYLLLCRYNPQNNYIKLRKIDCR